MAKDPLTQATPDAAHELFNRMRKQCNGFTHEAVVGAAVNLIINAARQAHGQRKGALDYFDEVATKGREILASHYTANGSRLVGVYPYPQEIRVPLINLGAKQCK